MPKSNSVNARVPSKGTQCRRLLDAMRRRKRMTIWNAMQEYRVGALHQRITDLRAMGWPVIRREVEINGKRVAEFSM